MQKEKVKMGWISELNHLMRFPVISGAGNFSIHNMR